jgi:hypothetical protein
MLHGTSRFIVSVHLITPYAGFRVSGRSLGHENKRQEQETGDAPDAGGGAVTVTPGSHYDEHGGACVYNFSGDGTWLQWSQGARKAAEVFTNDSAVLEANRQLFYSALAR